MEMKPVWRQGGKRLWRRALISLSGVALVLSVGPWAMREVELRGADVAIAPNRTAYAKIVGPGQVRIDGLPCGNVFAPPPLELRQLRITSIGWETDSLLVVTVADPIVQQQVYEWRGFRVVVRRSGNDKRVQ